MGSTKCEVEYLNNIIIFPKETKQNEFFDEDGNVRNGECVLSPNVCTCTRELNGCFELYIELTNPSDNIIKHISCWNYVVAPVQGRWVGSGKITRKNQIFYIIRIEKNCDPNGTIVYKIYAKHIFYILATEFIPADTWNSSSFARPMRFCRELIEHFSQHPLFLFSTNGSASRARRFRLSSDTNYVGAIMDVLEEFGNELHRDNFYFSSFGRKENSKGSSASPSFRLIHGKEINSITEVLDYTNTLTDIDVLNSDGNVQMRLTTPYKKIGMMCRTNGRYTTSKSDSGDQITDGLKYFHQVNHPELSCTISLNTINQSPEYSSFFNLVGCDIGDLGIVYSSTLHTNVLQKVSRTVEDILTGQYIEIVLGNIPGSIAKIRNNTNFIGLQKYINSGGNGGGFTAEVTVSDGKNAIDVAAAALSDSTDLNCDAIVDFGDTYIETMSSHANQSLKHKYAYNGTYILRYTDCFDEPGKVMGKAMSGTGRYNDSASVDNIIFFDGTKKIGQCYVEAEDNTLKLQQGVLEWCDSITKITIPSSVEYISSMCFPYCTNLKEIYFDGTISMWKKVSNSSLEQDKHFHSGITGWIQMYNVTVHCTDGDTVQPGMRGVNPKYGV